LGETLGKTILIDDDAAGYGWFVDPTPPMMPNSPLTATELVARPAAPPLSGRPVDHRDARDGPRTRLRAFRLARSHVSDLPLGERRLIAPGADAALALAVENLWNQRSPNNNTLDEVFASSTKDGKADLSWLSAR